MRLTYQVRRLTRIWTAQRATGMTSESFGGDRPSRHLGTATVFVVGLGLFVLWLFLLRPNQDWETYNTKPGQISHLGLPDGSMAHLNGASSIRYQKRFSRDRRMVFVTGQVYFEIAPDPRPLVVVTGKAEVIALGAALDVWQSKNKVRIYVPEGRALFFSGRAGANEVVREGHTAMCLEGGFVSVPRLADGPDRPHWLSGVFDYRDVPLGDVLTDLERGFGTRFRLTQPNLAWRTVSTRLEGEDLPAIVTRLCRTLNMEHRFESGSWLLSAKD